MSVPLQRLSASQAYRQSHEVAAFESEHDGPIDAALWASITASGGSISHETTISAHVVTVSSGSGARAVLRSHARPRASANRSRSCTVVGHCGSVGKPDQIKRWGLFDDNGGYFFEVDGESLYAVRRSNVSGSVVDTAIPREQWTVKGTATGLTAVDLTKTHIWEIREVWPNGDCIFLVDGLPVHQVDTDGSIIGPAFRNARLPVSVEVVNSASSVADHFAVISASVAVDGQAQSKAFSAEGSATLTTEEVLLSIRPALTFGSAANWGEILADTITATCTKATRFRLVVGGTLTGANWVAHTDATSFAQLDTTATVVAGGRSIAMVAEGGLAAADLVSLVSALRVQGDGATQDVLTITAESINGDSADVRAAVVWKEIR
jgi:hypothetical protein